MMGLLIDGELREAADGKTYDNINPATEQTIGQAPDASRSDVEAAVGAARRAFEDLEWSRDPTFRAHCLRQLLEGLRAEQEHLRRILIDEAGVPVALTHSIWLDTIIDSVSYWADLSESYPYETQLTAHATLAGVSSRRMILREPIGVVAAITPWNYPLPLNIFKVAAALAAGCSVVLKPAPDTPWSGTALGRIIAERTDVPDGIVNVVTSADPLIGEALVRDRRVDMITFTGSTEVGRRIMASAADNVTRVCLELGGKSANIVLDDADLPALAAGIAGVCAHAGQGCALPTRLLLPRSRYDEGLAVAQAAFESVSCGDPNDPDVIVGPVINTRQRDRILTMIERGKQEARILVGGAPASMPFGYYVEPTLFCDVEPDAVIAQEEIFGPVLAVIPYDDDDHAVEIANNSIYGLSGAVHSADIDRAMAVARRLRTGTVGINGGVWLAADTPFGGYKQSGLGRELGTDGFAEFLETKSIALPA
ncbi:aldehyde dehydrogenase family protein [Mycobacterium sp. CVI_P3]|uniref:Aldehyde dehydrogenase family protein n=1 Tax=Mycobacterium pinniadriaticum TaxID=2994102 RepID=A0ABT3SCN3_9MYCO|nr:aldehyde dehydrogenase family protein [Mycobacterium pinniadriaticum]MCX2930855.1 aldehyde dehydrogenase family protein [Mycobacterium pinniadriaticum]MCX2937279.1 aldehyde dehydrogenase family protein [Mycobacterium pinniadriaticum]